MKKNNTTVSVKLLKFLEEFDRQEMLRDFRYRNRDFLSNQEINDIEEYSMNIPQRVREFIEKQGLK